MTAPAPTRPHAASPSGDAASITTRPTGPTDRRLREAAIRIAVLAAAAAGWEAAARSAHNLFFPAPTTIAAWMRDNWLGGPSGHLFLSDELLHHAGASLGRMLTGLAGAAVLGVVLGLLLGRSRLAHDLANPLVQFGRSVPPVVLIPVYFLLFPPGAPTQIALIVTGAVWPVLLNTIAGVRAIDPGLLDAVRVLKIGRVRRIAQVVLPAAAPSVLVGLRISYAIALILMVVSELYAATDGIGYALISTQQSFDLPAMWAWIVLLAALGNAGNTALTAATRRVLAWHGQPELQEL